MKGGLLKSQGRETSPPDRGNRREGKAAERTCGLPIASGPRLKGRAPAPEELFGGAHARGQAGARRRARGEDAGVNRGPGDARLRARGRGLGAGRGAWSGREGLGVGKARLEGRGPRPRSLRPRGSAVAVGRSGGPGRSPGRGDGGDEVENLKGGRKGCRLL